VLVAALRAATLLGDTDAQTQALAALDAVGESPAGDRPQAEALVLLRRIGSGRSRAECLHAAATAAGSLARGSSGASDERVVQACADAIRQVCAWWP